MLLRPLAYTLALLGLAASAARAKPERIQPIAHGVLRYQDLEPRGRVPIHRWQTQLRLGAIWRLGEEGTEAEFRISTGPDTRPNLSFLNLDTDIDDQDLRADRALLRFRPREGVRVELGRVGSPHEKTEVILDSDVATDGVAAVVEEGPRRFSLLASRLTEPAHGDLDVGLLSLQVARPIGGWRAALGLHRFLDVADLARAYARGHVGGFRTNRRSAAADLDGDGLPDASLGSHYRLLELLVAGELGAAKARLDLVENLGATGRGSAALLELRFPELFARTTFTTRLFRIEQDASLADYLGETLHGTNRRGLHLELRRPVRKNLDFRAWWIRTLELDRGTPGASPAITEIRVDWIWKI